MRLFCAITFTACLLISGCRRHRPHRDDPFRQAKVDDAQKARAQEAANRLMAELNNATCQPIYNEASVFFRSQDSEAWGEECHALKKKLGAWSSFQVEDTQSWEAGVVVCLQGLAKFENESKRGCDCLGTKRQGLEALLDRLSTARSSALAANPSAAYPS